jgi:hypothetical protein
MKALAILLLLFAAPPQAATFADAESAFNAGQFAQAAALAGALHTADGDALVARAELVLAAYLAPPAERNGHLSEAETAARRALERNPDHVEAMLHLVIALGYRARQLSPLAAHSAGYGREAKALIARALILAPDDPWTHGIAGGWNGELVTAAGGFLAKLFYGASRQRMTAAFARAMTLAPGNPAIRVEYAKVLLRLDAERHAEEARALLASASALHPANAFEGLLQAQGARLLSAMDHGDAALLAALAEVTPFSRRQE